jgi:hypothetical protein
LSVFKTGAFNRSATFPGAYVFYRYAFFQKVIDSAAQPAGKKISFLRIEIFFPVGGGRILTFRKTAFGGKAINYLLVLRKIDC